MPDLAESSHEKPYYKYDEPSNAYEEAINRINIAHKNNSDELDLCSLGLTEIPPEIGHLTNLHRLRVYNNRLKSLPKELRNLPRLSMLYLGDPYVGGNDFTEIPPEVFQLTNLQSLTIANTKIQDIPKQIRNLSKLRFLYLIANDITSVSKGIEKLPLETIYLWKNRLKIFPLSLTEIKSLQNLTISYNFISELPSRIDNLSNLISLDVSNNNIFELPRSIGNLDSLEYLDLEENNITYLPTEIGHLHNLSKLNLGNNKISYLPQTLQDLPELKELVIQGNLLQMPATLMDLKKSKVLLEMYFSLNPPSRPLSIFLSYARADKAVASKIYSILENHGHSPWMDTSDLLPGEDFLNSIEDAIRNADLFIAVLSERSYNRRGFIQREIRIALDKFEEFLPDDIYIVPIRIDNCDFPKRLSHLQTLDWNNGIGLGKLMATIERVSNRVSD